MTKKFDVELLAKFDCILCKIKILSKQSIILDLENLKVLNEFEKFLKETHLAAHQGNKLKDGCTF